MTLAGNQGAGLRVAIMTDETGWHTAKLQKALRARGHEGRCVDLADCRIDTTRSAHGLVIPGFGRELPDAVLVRGIAGGSFEAVTTRLGFLHALVALGVPVYNDPRAIERAVDKAATSLLLHQAAIPTPPTWVTESPAEAQRVVMRESAAGHAVVVKPLFGSQGKGIELVGLVDGVHRPLPDLAGFGRLAYLQRYVPQARVPGHDWRVLVVGGKAVTAMKRVSEHWIHNIARGARCERCELTPALAVLAERASAALGLDYAGVDIVPSAVAGGLQVIEVNGVAAWRGLQRVTGFDIGQCLVDDLLDRRLGGLAGARYATGAGA
ncbi:ATP-grasp domain-containing protein [Derxia lacustris]|uniref:ATP-grasp domain-containing protein n=1 Tax=Derxia lacustris TaxID=764842 RepID=UPI000A16FA8A|nr:RimK family alpha-L-glutamate ligase [Derxia lacustris]